jgi:phage terminase large subunit-like protein
MSTYGGDDKMISEAERVIKFIETFLTLGHSFIGEPFILQEFQKDIIYDMYAEAGDGSRLRRTYVLGLPRKNGKSQLGAALAVYHLVGDKHDAAPHVYSAAKDRAQAKLVFDEAKRMINASPDLSEICETYRTEIRCTANGGIYRALSSDAGLQQGLNPSFVVFDELHTFKSPELYEALTLGAAARKSPLTMVISTAGYDLESPLGKLYQIGRLTSGHYLNGLRQTGENDNPSFGMTWWGPTVEDMQDANFNHEDPLVWRRYNPFWGIMTNPVAEFESAMMTTHESAFIRFKLNGWTTSAAAFLPAGSWAALEDPEAKIADREDVILGFDGAWKGDSTALVAVSLETFHMEVIGHWEAPPNNPDWRTPADVVEAVVIAATKKYNVKEMVADPYRFEQSLFTLQEEYGVPILEFPTNVRGRMIPATGGFFQAVMDQEFTHDGNAALARHLANANLRDTPSGAYITKEYKSSRNHIDLAVAAIIAVERARLWRKEAPASDDSLLLIL